MQSINRKLIIVATPLFIFHLIEEWYLQFHEIDFFVLTLSTYTGVESEIIFFVIQLILFVLLAFFLASVLLKRSTKYLGLITGTILIFEVDHITNSIVQYSYYPGLITGTLLLGLGVWYWYKLLILEKNKLKY